MAGGRRTAQIWSWPMSAEPPFLNNIGPAPRQSNAIVTKLSPLRTRMPMKAPLTRMTSSAPFSSAAETGWENASLTISKASLRARDREAEPAAVVCQELHRCRLLARSR